MNNQPKKKKEQVEMDAMELLARKFRAKCRFRAIFRLVVENLYWLSQEEEVYEGDDVKRRVEQAMRAKSKKEKALLTISDKALLNKPAEDRTISEKNYIYRKIGSLKCFRRYPNNVKKKLAAATYFRYYGPNRVIVRQHQDAHALYFIVTGEIIVSVMIFDELLHKYISIDVFVMHAGDMFGEVSLLHNIKRTATCTTSGHCELLALMKKDFKNVLQDSLQKQWDEVKLAMAGFTYFEGLDEVACREGCIVAKMKNFEPNETILGDDKGMPNFVYFILSGSCQMIESLKVIVEKTSGKKIYKLYDPFVDKPDIDLDLDKKYFKSLAKPIQLAAEDASSPIKDMTANTSTVKNTSPTGSSDKNTTLSFDLGKNTAQTSNSTKGTTRTSNSARETTHISGSTKGTPYCTSSSKVNKSCASTDKSSYKDVKSLPRSFVPLIPSSGIILPQTPRISLKIEPLTRNKTMDIQTYFMQVCIFGPGATFGFGENMRDRRIVAQTQMNCMLMPQVWLMQRNTANIWTRIQHYLHKKIPSKKQLFEEFVLQRRWLEYRDKIVEDIVSKSHTVNHTTLHDVPYSTRMQEMLDL